MLNDVQRSFINRFSIKYVLVDISSPIYGSEITVFYKHETRFEVTLFKATRHE